MSKLTQYEPSVDATKEDMLFWIQRHMARQPESFANDVLWRGYLIALNDMRKYIKEE